MAAVCRFWRISPSEYWALTVDELDALVRFQNNEIKERRQAEARARRR